MIGYLKGQILSLDQDELLLVVNHTGYQISMPESSIQNLSLGQTVELYIYTHVREDAFLLFGFLEQDERKLFAKLVTVSGVGPKLALSILNTLSPYELQCAIFNKNTTTLTKISGVGAKTAQRLILELDSVLRKCHFIQAKTGSISHTSSENHADTRSALQNLGFNDKIIADALEALDAEELASNDLNEEIRWALAYINKKMK